MSRYKLYRELVFLERPPGRRPATGRSAGGTRPRRSTPARPSRAGLGRVPRTPQHLRGTFAESPEREAGGDLARVARANLAGFGVQVTEGAFEDWRPPPDVRFGLVFAATAWHWVDPAQRYVRAHEALRPGGYLAFWSAEHVLPDGGDPFFRELQEVYDEIGEGLPSDAVFPRPGELRSYEGDIGASGLFDLVYVRHFDWARRYDAEQYIALLDTFSGHILMAGWQRDRLYGEIRSRLARCPDGMLRRHWGAVLHVARRT